MAITSIFLGTAAAALLINATQSAFTLVAIGTIIVRAAQILILSKLRARVGSLSAMLITAILGTLMVTALGLGFYGGDAISTPLAIFEAIFIPPAYVLAKAVGTGSGLDRKILGVVVSITTTGIFLSAAPYLIPLGILASLSILLIASYAILIQRRLSDA